MIMGSRELSLIACPNDMIMGSRELSSIACPDDNDSRELSLIA